MVSFDVVSLFPSIPLDIAKSTTERLLRQNTSWKEHTSLEVEDVMSLLDLCLSTEFVFNGRFYRQTKGTPMGSPLSTFLAEAVLQDLEQRTVDNNEAIKMWERYVDDVFATVKTNEIDNVLQTINNATDNITFTVEQEHDNQLAFLDVLLTKNDDGTLNTQVYRKGTHTDQVLNYNSNHPTAHKISCVKTLFKRIDTHCNTQQAKQDERNYLYKTFRKNNYPTKFINRFTKRKRTTQLKHNPHNEQKTEKQRLTLPYIKTVSEITARLLKHHNVDVAHKPTNKLRTTFTGHKDKTEQLQRANAIYTFSCHNCTSTYIGETSKKVATRLQEHNNAIKRHDPLSLPANHADEHGHTFNLADTKILGHAKTRRARQFKEAWHSTNKATFNRHIDIPTIYQQLRRRRIRTTTQNNLSSNATRPITTINSSDTNNAEVTIDNQRTHPTSQRTEKRTSVKSRKPPDNPQPIRRSQRLAARRPHNDNDSVMKTDTIQDRRHHF